MLEKYSFVPIFTCLIGGVAWWSAQVGPSAQNGFGSVQPGDKRNVTQVAHRRELVEFLDRLVSYERYYHSVYGHYTKTIQKTGLLIPRSISASYDIRVTDATESRVLITAAAVGPSDSLADLASINQDYNFQSNFRLPPPRPSYLKAHAFKQLRLLKEAPVGQSVEEQGVYRGYFKFSVRVEEDDPSVPVKGSLLRKVSARGVKPPVAGVFLELNNKSLTTTGADLELELSLLAEPEELADVQTGQAADSLVAEGNVEEEAKLAQRIFRGEIGRSAKSWSELSKIAHFNFEGKDKNGELLGSTDAQRKVQRATSSVLPRNEHGLEIESVQFEEVGE